MSVQGQWPCNGAYELEERPAGSRGGGPDTLCDGVTALALNAGLVRSEVLVAFGIGAGAVDMSPAATAEPVAGGTGV